MGEKPRKPSATPKKNQINHRKTGTRIRGKQPGTGLRQLVADLVLDPKAANKLFRHLQDHVSVFLLPGIQPSAASTPLFWPEPKVMSVEKHQAKRNEKKYKQKHRE